MIFEVDFTGKNVEMISAKILTALYINNTWSCFTINLMEGKPSRKRGLSITVRRRRKREKLWRELPCFTHTGIMSCWWLSFKKVVIDTFFMKGMQPAEK